MTHTHTHTHTHTNTHTHTQTHTLADPLKTAMELSTCASNVALARELADGSDYNSALTYYEMSLSYMAK